MYKNIRSGRKQPRPGGGNSGDTGGGKKKPR